MSDEGVWTLIESDPAVLNEMLRGFGVEGVQVEELHSAADEETSGYNRARRVVENYFGILANRFRILLRPITGPPAVARQIALAIMILYNLLVDSVGAEVAVQRYGLSGPIEEAEQPGVSGNVSYNSKTTRDVLKEYFARRDGFL